jgi:hypothetical protein
MSLAVASADPLAFSPHWALAPAVIAATAIRAITVVQILLFRFIFIAPALVGLVVSNLRPTW